MTGPETAAGVGRPLLLITLSYLLDEGGEARTVLRAVGEVDLSTADMLAEHLHRVLGTGADAVVADLEAVSFISARGVDALVQVAESARPRGIPFRVRAADPRVVRVFELTGTVDLVGLRVSGSVARDGSDGAGPS
ncbi:MAG TPA: STAS domain-containing protein [Pseudonocardiaceae bacterium]|nr:STAS domain-containing protein [Pseudonocardiaceae bacterium]